MPEDTEFRLQMSNAGLSGSALLVDEWREQNGFDPLPKGAGQVLFVPYASMPTKPEELLTETVRENDVLTPDSAFFTDPVSGVKGGSRRKAQLARRERARLLAVQERAARRSMERFFTAQTDEIMAAMGTGHKDDREDFWQRIQSGQGLTFDIEVARRLAKEALEQLIDWKAQDEALSAVLNPVWEEAFNAGARSIEQFFGIKAIQAPRLTDYLRQYGLERVKGINATTRDKLASSLADGLEAGESTAQLVLRVQEYMPKVQAERAAAIALSESHTSLQAGSFEQMRFGGVRTKTWVTAGDEDVRDSHRNIHPKTIPINERFSNGLMYPGDPSGAPSEIIRCRCDLLPGDFEETTE